MSSKITSFLPEIGSLIRLIMACLFVLSSSNNNVIVFFNPHTTEYLWLDFILQQKRKAARGIPVLLYYLIHNACKWQVENGLSGD